MLNRFLAMMVVVVFASPAFAQSDTPEGAPTPPPESDSPTSHNDDGPGDATTGDATPSDVPTSSASGPATVPTSMEPAPIDENPAKAERHDQAQDSTPGASSDDEPRGAPDAPSSVSFDGALREMLLEGAADDALEDEVSIIGRGRLRLQLPHTADGGDTAAPELALGAYVGAAVPAGRHTLTVTVGDGFIVGQDRTMHISELLYEVKADMRFTALGAPATLTLGRMTSQISDGRILAVRPFLPRIGRPLDGAHVTTTFADSLTLNARAFYLGPYDALNLGTTSFVAAFDLQEKANFMVPGTELSVDIDLAGYLIYHKDGTLVAQGVAPINAVTAGTRFTTTVLDVKAKLGLDGQGQTLDDDPLTPNSGAVHAEADLRYNPEFRLFHFPWKPFIGVATEVTYGKATGNRVFRTPNGGVHAFLGNLDLFLLDNIAAARVFAGATIPNGFATEISAQAFGLADPSGPLVAPDGTAFLTANSARTQYGLAGVEFDLDLTMQVHERIALHGQYGVALFSGPLEDRPLTQRLLLSVDFTL